MRCFGIYPEGSGLSGCPICPYERPNAVFFLGFRSDSPLSLVTVHCHAISFFVRVHYPKTPETPN